MNLMLFPTPQHKTDDVPSDAELARFIPGNAIAAGRAYAQAGRVLRVSVLEDGHRIEAETQGSRRTPYAETIVLRRDAQGSLRIVGLCSCAVRTNCKHVAAVLIVARGRHKLAPAPAQTSPVPPPRIALSLVVSPQPQPQARPAPPPREEPLPYPLANWLADLESAQQADEEDYPPSIRQRLFYVLDKAPQARGIPALSVQPVSVQLRKTGEFSAAQRNFPPESVHGQQPARFLRPSDRVILRRLARRRHGNDEDEDPQDTVRRIIATGRARWGSVTGTVANEGPPRPGRIVWVLNEDGSQHPEVTLEAPGATLLRVPEPWYAEPATGTLGPIALDLPALLARRLLAAPAVPPEQAARVRSELARRMPSLTVPAPDELPPPELLNERPRPHLVLLTGSPPLPHGMLRYGGGPAIPLARLSFGYGPFVIASNERRTNLARGGKLYRLVRQRDAEERLAQRLTTIGFDRVGRIAPSWYANPWADDLMLPGDQDGAAWLRVLLHDLPVLRAEGWTIEIADDFPIRLAEPDGDLSAKLEEGSGIDWLELHLGVMVDGKRVDLVPSLVAMIASSDGFALSLPERLNGADDDEPFLVPLRDGRFLPLPLTRIRPILLALTELFARGGVDPAGGAIRFTRLDAADVAALEEASGVVWQGGESLRALGRQLREAGGSIPTAVVPESFRGTLRPYQAQGVDWLQFLRGAELGGVLADDMGLGKTVQTLAHLAIEQAEGRLDRPSLIVCPTSVVPNWTMEAARFAPSLRVLTLHGPTRKERFGEIARHDLVISTYPLLTRDHAVLTEHEWHVVVLDEAQMIKNPNAATTRQALRLRARQRLSLSGTPLQNHLGELWSLFDFLAPGFLGSARSFRTRFRTPIEKHGDAARGEMLTKRVRPFLLRRTKEEVALDLPPKTEITESGGAGDGAARDLRGRAAVDACAGAAGDRREGDRAVRHHHPRCAAEAAPGLLRSAAAEAGRGGEDEGGVGQAGAPDGAADGAAGGGAAGAAVLAVHLDAGADRGAAGGGRAALRDADRRHGGSGERGAAVPGGRGAAVPDQPEGRRGGAEPDRGGYGDPLRSVVEPGGGGPGDRPRAPDRAGQEGVRAPAGHAGDDRGEDGGAEGEEARDRGVRAGGGAWGCVAADRGGCGGAVRGGWRIDEVGDQEGCRRKRNR